MIARTETGFKISRPASATAADDTARARLQHGAALANAMESQTAFSWIGGSKRGTIQAGVYLTHSQSYYEIYILNVESKPHREAALAAAYN